MGNNRQSARSQGGVLALGHLRWNDQLVGRYSSRVDSRLGRPRNGGRRQCRKTEQDVRVPWADELALDLYGQTRALAPEQPSGPPRDGALGCEDPVCLLVAALELEDRL